jgi:hypothetical protein
MENLGIFYDHLVYFTAIGNILWPFGTFCGHLVYFSPFGILYQEKSGNPGMINDLRCRRRCHPPHVAFVSKECKTAAESGLPDGRFSYQTPKFCYIWKGLGMENFDIYYV